MSRALLIRTIAATVTISAANIAYGCSDTTPCHRISHWHESNQIDLTVSTAGTNGHSHWEISLDQSQNDFYVEIDEIAEDKHQRGQIAVVGGKFLISNNLELNAGYEIDAIDNPLLMMQLLLNVLHYAVPEGPDQISSDTPFLHYEAVNPIQVGSASASGTFDTPWSAEGDLSPNENGAISYSFKFESPRPGKNLVLNMRGSVANKPFEALPLDMDLEGWNIHAIGTYSRNHKEGETADYGAQPMNRTYKKIEHLRKAIND